jgi:S1-C subfamily serine protease
MNALDFGLLVLFVFLLSRKSAWSASRVIPSGGGIALGIVTGLVIASFISQLFSQDVHKGIIALLIITLICYALLLIGGSLGSRMRTRLLDTRFERADRYLGVPMLFIVSLVVVSLLGSALVHIPLLGLQFEVQGSAMMINARKYTLIRPVEDIAKRIHPDQFKNLVLDYDPNPITAKSATETGEFQQVVDVNADSIVRVSGRSCAYGGGIGKGSGFVAAPKYIVTNAHVIVGASTIYVQGTNGVYPATPIVFDKDYDTAILYSEFLDIKPVEFSTSEVRPGEPVVTLGFPSGGDFKATVGTLLPTPPNLFQGVNTKLDDSTSLHAALNVVPGNSGGALFNADGQVVGVVNAGEGGKTNAIKSEIIKQLLLKAQNSHFSTKTSTCEVLNWYKDTP